MWNTRYSYSGIQVLDIQELSRLNVFEKQNTRYSYTGMTVKRNEASRCYFWFGLSHDQSNLGFRLKKKNGN